MLYGGKYVKIGQRYEPVPFINWKLRNYDLDSSYPK